MNCIKIAEDTVKLHRDKLGAVPQVLPVFYKGLQMTVDEAWAVVRAFEQEKGSYLKWHSNTETGAGVTKTVFDGISGAADTTGKGLKASPFTAIAGNLVGGLVGGISDLGETISGGIREINKRRHHPLIAELDKQIAILEKAINDVKS
jgi:hypothetical protein